MAVPDNIVPIIVLIVLFIGIMIVFSKEDWDYVGFSLLACIIGVIVTLIYVPDVGEKFIPVLDPNEPSAKYLQFLIMIDFETILFLLSMQMIVSICEQHKIFQWVALKTLYFTKGNHRRFFYLICIISAFTASLIADITVAVIFIPLVIRACKILRIDATPYLFGISFTVNIGSLYTPFSSSENILISSTFDRTLGWFLKSFTIYVVPMLLFTLFILDMVFLRKIEPPTEERKKILLEIMDPDIVIVNKQGFILNSMYFIAVIIGFVIYDKSWVIAFIGAVLMVILNKLKFTETSLKIDWKIIFFFIALFLLIGCMELVGIFTYLEIAGRVILPDNHLLAAIIVLVLIGVLSGILAQVPTALVFIALLQSIYGIGNVPDIILMGFLFGINLGSNFLPQGAAVDLMALNLAKKNGIKKFNYNSLLKNGSLMTIVHIGISIVYLTVFSLFI